MPVMAPVTPPPLARRVATVLPARSICDNNQPPKISPAGLASAGIAMARNAGSDFGGASVVSLAVIVEFSCLDSPKVQPIALLVVRSVFPAQHGFVAHRLHDLE